MAEWEVLIRAVFHSLGFRSCKILASCLYMRGGVPELTCATADTENILALKISATVAPPGQIRVGIFLSGQVTASF